MPVEGPVGERVIEAGTEPAPMDDLVLRPRRRVRLWAAVAVGVVAALFVGVLATRPSALSKQARSPLVGHPAPAIPGPSVTDAPFSSLPALQGRWVLVNFFATWCVPCRQEHPEFIRFTQRHQAAGDASVVMVIYSDKVADVQSFFRTKGGDWPAVADPAGRVALDYGVSGVPETYLVDPRGMVVAKIIGGVTADGLDNLIVRAKAAG